ncbi:MAG: hypothetical protein ACRCUX_09490 [Beijerinckiaceae bacterium]
MAQDQKRGETAAAVLTGAHSAPGKTSAHGDHRHDGDAHAHHAHHGHHAHSHHTHGHTHAHAAHDHGHGKAHGKPEPVRFSLLRLSAGERVTGAGLILLVLWGIVAWGLQ